MPKFAFLTTIDIDSPAEHAWGVLTDFARYTSWCPTHRAIIGEARLGAKLKIQLAREPHSDKTLTVPVTVRQFDPYRQLAFGGGIPGALFLFDIHHWFRIEPLGDNRCRFHNGEEFRGVILALLRSTLSQRVQQGYGAFNEAFKNRCEES